MNLVELVKYFRNGDSYQKFCLEQGLDLEAEVVEIYMTKPLGLDNDLTFFEIEQTEGRVEFESDNITYFYLFDFYYFLDVIEESNNIENKELEDDDIAGKLLAYAIRDA